MRREHSLDSRAVAIKKRASHSTLGKLCFFRKKAVSRKACEGCRTRSVVISSSTSEERAARAGCLNVKHNLRLRVSARNVKRNECLGFTEALGGFTLQVLTESF